MTYLEANRRYIQIGLQAFVFRENLLLMGIRKNAFAAGTYGVPGGRLEFGESFDETIARELLEETGMTVTSSRLFGVCNNTFPEGSHHVQLGFVVECGSDVPENLEPEKCIGWEFININTLPNNINPATLGLLQQFLELVSK